MALYMTVILIGRYGENRSATSISYKKYAETDEDLYPATSICLRGEGLYRYNGSAIYEAYGINSANYERMIQGKPAFRYEYDPTNKLYNRTSLPAAYTTHYTFEEILQSSHKITDIIKKAHFTTVSSSHS